MASLLKDTEGIADFNMMGRQPTLRTQAALLQEFVGESIVGRGLWPPRSPDITPPDFFLWGFLNGRVHSKNPRSWEEMEHNIEQTVASIDPETLRKVARNTLERVNARLREGSVYFRHLL
jgi:hypothetical protein